MFIARRSIFARADSGVCRIDMDATAVLGQRVCSGYWSGYRLGAWEVCAGFSSWSEYPNLVWTKRQFRVGQFVRNLNRNMLWEDFGTQQLRGSSARQNVRILIRTKHPFRPNHSVLDLCRKPLQLCGRSRTPAGGVRGLHPTAHPSFSGVQSGVHRGPCSANLYE